MARPPARPSLRAPAFSIITMMALGSLIPGAGAAAAQDTWLLFQKDERAGRRGTPVAPDGSGVREGDRPLEPRGGAGRERASEPPASLRQGYGTSPPSGPRSAAPVAVERQELAPIQAPSAPAPMDASTAPAPRLGTRSAPPVRTPAPTEPRERGLAPPPSRVPIQPSALQRAPQPPPAPIRSAVRPSLGGLATLTPKALEDIVDGVELPSKSAAIAALWPEPWREAGASPSPAFEAIRIETLRRAGAVSTLKSVLERVTPPSEPVLAIVVLRAHLLVGNREAGCALAGEAIRNRAAVPTAYRRDAVLAAGYCALAGGNTDAGKLTIDLIRGESLDAPFALAVLEGAGKDGRAAPPLPASVGVLDYRLGEVAGLVWPSEIAERAEPAVLAVMATASAIDPGLKVVAVERALRLNLLQPDTLAGQYRDLPMSSEDLASPLTSKRTGHMRRALLMQAAEAEAAPDKRARLIAALLDDAGKAGLKRAVAGLLGPMIERMSPAPDIAWFAESAAEILVQSGRGGAVDRWADLTRDLEHWRVLGALSAGQGTAPGSNGLAGLERLARAGRIDAPRLHRVATVLDALDVQIPIPLWEAASRTPQPIDGHLPATGVLAELKTASTKGNGAGVVLRVAQAMGPATAADANLLVLGDVIRALKGVGLEQEARALGIEALIEAWSQSAR